MGKSKYRTLECYQMEPSTTDEDLTTLFSKYGKVITVCRYDSFAFVEMDTVEHAVSALKHIHRTVVNGKLLFIANLIQDETKDDRLLKKIKSIGSKREDVVCPVCLLILRPKEEPKFCKTCNVGLKCETYPELHKGENVNVCLDCDGFFCDNDDCFNKETQTCF